MWTVVTVSAGQMAWASGIQFYAHQVGTLWVDEVIVFPEPTMVGVLALGGLLLTRRRRSA